MTTASTTTRSPLPQAAPQPRPAPSDLGVGTLPRATGVTPAVTCADEDWTGIGTEGRGEHTARAAQEK